MALRPEHELHARRRGRNLGLLAVLLLFVALIFALSIVKIQNGDMMEGFDHQPRASMLPREPAQGEAANQPSAAQAEDKE